MGQNIMLIGIVLHILAKLIYRAYKNNVYDIRSGRL